MHRESQRVIIETLQQENAKFSDCPSVKEVMQTVITYIDYVIL